MSNSTVVIEPDTDDVYRAIMPGGTVIKCGLVDAKRVKQIFDELEGRRVYEWDKCQSRWDNFKTIAQAIKSMLEQKAKE
jgi:hypothetical protein